MTKELHEYTAQELAIALRNKVLHKDAQFFRLDTAMNLVTVLNYHIREQKEALPVAFPQLEHM